MAKLSFRSTATTCAIVSTLTFSGIASIAAAAQDKGEPGISIATPLSPANNTASPETSHPDSDAPTTDKGADERPANLDSLIARQSAGGAIDSQLRCLATAIYYEASYVHPASQLAIGRVIVARTKSGRFPTSYCGVVTQPSQFSFVRRGVLPAVKEGSSAWRSAVAIARIADAGSWQSQVEGALFFHSAMIAPHWRMQRLARIDNTVFYR